MRAITRVAHRRGAFSAARAVAARSCPAPPSPSALPSQARPFSAFSAVHSKQRNFATVTPPNPASDLRSALRTAGVRVARADALIVVAGHGMAFDCGIPKLTNFETSYPNFAALGLTYQDVASPAFFKSDPRRAWAFHASRYERALLAQPHSGYAILYNLATKGRKFQPFVVTTQIEELFQRSGFPADRIVETQGSIHYLSCLNSSCDTVIPSRDAIGKDDGSLGIKVDRKSHLADLKTVPRCLSCGSIMRPNILLPQDEEFNASRMDKQKALFDRFLADLTGSQVVVLEIGAGTINPVLRQMSESVTRELGGFLVRINVDEAEVEEDLGVGIKLGAEAALGLLEDAVELNGTKTVDGIAAEARA